MRSIREDLALGSLHGIALSVLGWCWALGEWTAGTALLLLAGVAALALAARERKPRGSNVVPFRPAQRRPGSSFP